MSRIFARSPYIITVNEASQTAAKIEVFIWNGTGSAPSLPQYTLTKAIPSSTAPACYFNISPMVREYITHPTNQNIYNSNTTTPTTQWCNVKVKRYKYVGGYTLLDTTTYYAYDGYGEYAENSNPQASNYFLDEGTYYYHYDSGATLSTDPLKRAGFITYEDLSGFSFKYTNLVTGATSTSVVPDSRIRDIYRVNSTWYADGNKLEIFNASNVLQRTYYFRPIQECKYTPQVIDYVNKYGAWSRMFAFKASYEEMEMENKTFDLLHSTITSYSTVEGNRKTFNTNSKGTTRVNTGFVSEEFNNELKQLMNSERILLNGKPVEINTKKLAFNKSINSKLFNYTLEFSDSYDFINNIV